MKLSAILVVALQSAAAYCGPLPPVTPSLALGGRNRPVSTNVAAIFPPSPVPSVQKEIVHYVHNNADLELGKRAIDWSKLVISSTCQICVTARAAATGFTYAFRRGSVPTSFFPAFALSLSDCYEVCNTMVTAVNFDGVEKSMSESSWIAYVTGG
ncbi:hypothetical protein BKA66DRAFT_575903 [Pyrenochaeta sp. MPI-SDFR-AT-0127]|nr:hypothetical protein BKA66DRAFT_575903 [Pyrenochaeta sp. MPI-SDFR-AT-0127]